MLQAQAAERQRPQRLPRPRAARRTNSARMPSHPPKLYNQVSEVIANPSKAAKDAVKDLFAMENYYMYLVCELCNANQSSPRENGPWPIDIQKAARGPSRWHRNRAAGESDNARQQDHQWSRWSGPHVRLSCAESPREMIDACGSTIDFLQQDSSVDEYAMVEKLAANDGLPTEKAAECLAKSLCVRERA